MNHHRPEAKTFKIHSLFLFKTLMPTILLTDDRQPSSHRPLDLGWSFQVRLLPIPSRIKKSIPSEEAYWKEED
jgi:hypothetical protein